MIVTPRNVSALLQQPAVAVDATDIDWDSKFLGSEVNINKIQILSHSLAWKKAGRE